MDGTTICTAAWADNDGYWRTSSIKTVAHHLLRPPSATRPRIFLSTLQPPCCAQGGYAWAARAATAAGAAVAGRYGTGRHGHDGYGAPPTTSVAPSPPVFLTSLAGGVAGYNNGRRTTAAATAAAATTMTTTMAAAAAPRLEPGPSAALPHLSLEPPPPHPSPQRGVTNYCLFPLPALLPPSLSLPPPSPPPPPLRLTTSGPAATDGMGYGRWGRGGYGYGGYGDRYGTGMRVRHAGGRYGGRHGRLGPRLWRPGPWRRLQLSPWGIAATEPWSFRPRLTGVPPRRDGWPRRWLRPLRLPGGVPGQEDPCCVAPASAGARIP